MLGVFVLRVASCVLCVACWLLVAASWTGGDDEAAFNRAAAALLGALKEAFYDTALLEDVLTHLERTAAAAAATAADNDDDDVVPAAAGDERDAQVGRRWWVVGGIVPFTPWIPLHCRCHLRPPHHASGGGVGRGVAQLAGLLPRPPACRRPTNG